jgi:hypothetical protein
MLVPFRAFSDQQPAVATVSDFLTVGFLIFGMAAHGQLKASDRGYQLPAFSSLVTFHSSLPQTA